MLEEMIHDISDNKGCNKQNDGSDTFPYHRIGCNAIVSKELIDKVS